MDYKINVNNKLIIVSVSKKNMKTVRLKVFPSGEVCLSVPDYTPDEWIADFLQKKHSWISEKLIHFENTKAIEKEEHIFPGSSTRIMGKQLITQLEKASQKKIELIDSKLLIYTTDINNQIDIDKQFNNWWQKTSKEIFNNVLDGLYPIIQKHNIERPKIVVKKMSTLWGSCSRKFGNINLNFYLFKAPMPCIEYVILHELTHFLYPNHSKEFKNFLTIHMPDWQERKRILDYEIVLGI